MVGPDKYLHSFIISLFIYEQGPTLLIYVKILLWPRESPPLLISFITSIIAELKREIFFLTSAIMSVLRRSCILPIAPKLSVSRISGELSKVRPCSVGHLSWSAVNRSSQSQHIVLCQTIFIYCYGLITKRVLVVLCKNFALPILCTSILVMNAAGLYFKVNTNLVMRKTTDI